MTAPTREGVAVAVPAAGSGRRMGGRKKAFLVLAGEPLLAHALRPFLAHPRVTAVAVALPPDAAAEPPDWLGGLDARIRLVPGGATRLQSVRAALEALAGTAGVVLVHDAARPLVTGEIIDRCVRVAEGGEGAVAGWPCVDTLQETDPRGRILSTPDRNRFWRAQTPQGFPLTRLREAYARALEEGVEATDDAGVFARAGGRVRMVRGSPWNLKVTHPEDAVVAECLLARRREGGAA